MIDFIEDIFLSLDPIEEQPVDFVKCINLAPVARKAWRYHTNERATLASLLSVCAHCTDNLRFCARRLASMYHVSYRRLEEYAKWCGFVERLSRWIGYGKLVEATLYYYYESPRRKRWSRHLEVRLYFTVPIHFTAYDTLLRIILEDLDAIARYIIDYWYGSELAEELELDREESVKHGIRVVSKDYLEIVASHTSKLCPYVLEPETDAGHAPCCLQEFWCNEIVRSSYDYIQAIIVDYRRRVSARHNYCYDFSKKELSFINMREYIERWFKWW